MIAMAKKSKAASSPEPERNKKMDERETLAAFIESLDMWTLVCGLLVGIGVMGEFGIGYLHWSKGKRLRALDDAARVTQEENIGMARRDAANAQEKAEHERLARVQLEVRLAPRRLDPGQVAAIVTALAPHAVGAKHVALISPPDLEPAQFTEVLIQLLRDSGWNVTSVYERNVLRVVENVAMEVAHDADGSTMAAAQAFVGALRAADITINDPVPMQAYTLLEPFTAAGTPPLKNPEEARERLKAATIRISVGQKR